MPTREFLSEIKTEDRGFDDLKLFMATNPYSIIKSDCRTFLDARKKMLGVLFRGGEERRNSGKRRSIRKNPKKILVNYSELIDRRLLIVLEYIRQKR